MGETPPPSPPILSHTTPSPSPTLTPPSTPPPSSPPTAASPIPTPSLLQPSQKKRHRPSKLLRAFRSAFRSLPIITPSCKFPNLPYTLPGENQFHRHRAPSASSASSSSSSSSGNRVTGTLYGYRKGRVTLSVQENPRTLPTAVVELAILTSSLQKEMSLGMVRIALECEKRPEKDRTGLLDEPVWTVYCNGKKSGYGVRREASPEDLRVMELLRAVSMGAGVLPPGNNYATAAAEAADAELAYMRAHFERVVGSRDSETLYMMSPEGNNGPELSIFFVRI